MLQRIRYIVVLVTLVLASPAHGASPPPPSLSAAVRACVERNLPRYSSPSTAVLAQYISLVAACRAALAHEHDVELTLTPLGGTGPGATVRAETGPQGGSTQASAAPPASSPKTGSRTRKAPAASGVSACPGCAISRTGALTRVRVALAKSPSSRGLPSLVGLDAAPAWLLWLVGTLGLAAVSAGAVRVWRRPR